MGSGWARDCASSFLFRVVDSQKISEKLPTNNHVENKAAQQKFANQLKSMVATINDMVNLFEYENTHLIRLHSKDIMDASSIGTISFHRKSNAFQSFHGPVDTGSHSILVALVMIKPFVVLCVDSRDESRLARLVAKTRADNRNRYLTHLLSS
jgi:hypothetical protein